MDTLTRDGVTRRRAGGLAALYLALALIAAIPYFLVVVDYPGAVTAADKVALIVANYSSMYAIYMVSYVLFGIAIGILALALNDRLRTHAPFAAAVATAIGGLWSVALVMSGMVFTYGMTTVVGIAETDMAQASVSWQAIEPVAMALGGAGGELLGGLWVLTLCVLALRTGALPKALGWLGVAIGATGLVSVVPPVHDAAYVFGLLQIVWFAWLGVTLLRTKPSAVETEVRGERSSARAPLPVASH